MTAGDVALIVVIPAVLLLVDVVASLVGHRPAQFRKGRSEQIYLIVAVAVAATLVLSPVVTVFVVLVVFNVTLGQQEFVPFSTYAMFSRPKVLERRARFHTLEGDVLDTSLLGVRPDEVNKLWLTAKESVKSRHPVPDDLRQAAAELLVMTLAVRRSVEGIDPLRIGYTLDEVTVRPDGEIALDRVTLVRIPDRTDGAKW